MDWIWDLFRWRPRDIQDAQLRGDMDWIRDLFRRLPRDIQDAVSFPSGRSYEDLALPPVKRTRFAASSSRSAPEETARPKFVKVNDYVYELHNPSGRRPSIELVFFHGLELKGTRTGHVASWLSRDGSELWLDWIVKALPEARILTVSYDAHSERSDEHGRTDMYVTTENLLHCLIDQEAHVGQDGCPVVLIGHCLGGLVMKELCVKAHSNLSPLSSERLKTLLGNIRGLFFYASPHHGTKLADMPTRFIKGPLFKDVTTLNTETERRNEDFRHLRQHYKWISFGIGESVELTLGSFRGLLVAEASARCDVDGFYTDSADHFTVSRPHSTTSSSFTLLMNFVAIVLKEDKARCGHKISVTNDVVGLQKEVNKVQGILRGTRRLGIVGMAGLGKTTLAQTLYDTISGNFEYTCFLLEAKNQMGKNVHISELRRIVTKSLWHKGRKVEDEFEWCELKGKKVLIILDDVVSKPQIMVMVEEDEFSDESRIIVTSRDKRFLVSKGFKFHTVALLSEEDSENLFCKNAFGSGTPDTGFEDLVEKFIQKCQGLPLALTVTGSYLCKQSKKVWDASLRRLGDAKALDGNVEDGFWSILRVSYESLQPEEKEMFLDIATCYHGERLDEVKELWRACSRTYDDCGWVNLVDKGLVTAVKRVGEFYYGEFIQMHEVLRDLGQSIACPDPESVPSHSRVTYQEDEESSWPFHQEKPKVKVFKINSRSGMNGFRGIRIRGIREFGDLRVLWLSRVDLDGACQLFPRNLMCLYITHLDRWTNSSIEESFPEELEQHQALRYLNIKNSRLDTLPRSLGHLHGLQHLTISKCDNLEALPDSMGELRDLKILRISLCRNITLPETIGKLKALEHLTIDQCQKLHLPNTVGELQALKHLVVRWCGGLGVLGDVLGKFQVLVHLEIYTHDRLEFSPNTLPKLQALKHLDLYASHIEVSLLESLVRIQKLEFLSIRRYQDLKSVSDNFLGAPPDTFGELRSLKCLRLRGFEGSEFLPETLGQLQALEVLHIADFPSLKLLPNSLGRLKSLKRLEIMHCPVLEDIPDTLGDLQNLEYLWISRCSFKALPSTLGQLQALMHLELWYCKRLEYLPDTIGQLQALKHLKMCDGGLRALPGTLGGLQTLETLSLVSCHFLEALPDTLGLLHALKYLQLRDCPHIETLPVSLGHLQSLEVLSITHGLLLSLPETLRQLESLGVLKIDAWKRTGNSSYIRAR